jgi:hypothetical protein
MVGRRRSKGAAGRQWPSGDSQLAVRSGAGEKHQAQGSWHSQAQLRAVVPCGQRTPAGAPSAGRSMLPCPADDLKMLGTAAEGRRGDREDRRRQELQQCCFAARLHQQAIRSKANTVRTA